MQNVYNNKYILLNYILQQQLTEEDICLIFDSCIYIHPYVSWGSKYIADGKTSKYCYREYNANTTNFPHSLKLVMYIPEFMELFNNYINDKTFNINPENSIYIHFLITRMCQV
jgi:hypothetical protein